MRCCRKTCSPSCFQKYLVLAPAVLATPLPGAGGSVFLPVPPPTLRAEWLCREVPPPDHVFAGAGLSAAWHVLFCEPSFLACGLDLGAGLCTVPWLLSGHVCTLFPPQVGSVLGRAPGAMASRGRKRKAEAAVVAAADKREKQAGGQKGVEEATVVIEHCTS